MHIDNMWGHTSLYQAFCWWSHKTKQSPTEGLVQARAYWSYVVNCEEMKLWKILGLTVNMKTDKCKFLSIMIVKWKDNMLNCDKLKNMIAIHGKTSNMMHWEFQCSEWFSSHIIIPKVCALSAARSVATLFVLTQIFRLKCFDFSFIRRGWGNVCCLLLPCIAHKSSDLCKRYFSIKPISDANERER